jgi:hypothetical protein
MACGSACCAAPEVLPLAPTLPPPELNADCSVVSCKDIGSQKKPESEKDDCCVSPAEDTLEKKTCCSSKPINVEPHDQEVPSCCEGKSFPCCDTSCIDRLALRECAAEGKYPLLLSTTRH